jgi:hypothetical protein
MQAGIARASDGSPTTLLLVKKDHVIEVVDRLEAQNQRRKTVLLEDDGGEERRLEAMRAAVPDDSAEAPQGCATVRLLVVRQPVEIALNIQRRPQPRNQPSLAG